MEAEEVGKHCQVGHGRVVGLVAEGRAGVEDEEGEVSAGGERVRPEEGEENADGGVERLVLGVARHEERDGGVGGEVKVPDDVGLAREGGEEGEEGGAEMRGTEGVEMREEEGEECRRVCVEELGVEEGDGVEPDCDGVGRVRAGGAACAGAEGCEEGGEEWESEGGCEEGGEAEDARGAWDSTESEAVKRGRGEVEARERGYGGVVGREGFDAEGAAEGLCLWDMEELVHVREGLTVVQPEVQQD